jgi:hypothetical protein
LNLTQFNSIFIILNLTELLIDILRDTFKSILERKITISSLKKFVSSAISLAIAVSLVLSLTIGFSGTAMAGFDPLTGVRREQLQPIEECVPVQGKFTVRKQGIIKAPATIKSAVVKLNPPDLSGYIDIIQIQQRVPNFQCQSIPVKNGDDLIATCNKGSIHLSPLPFIYFASGEFDPPGDGQFCVELN